MPWSETKAMEQAIEFVRDWRTGNHTVSDLCAMYGIRRRTRHKWIGRYVEQDPDGLMERSHVAHSASNRTAPEMEEALLAMRLRHPSWGAKRLLVTVAERRPGLELPHRSTVCKILSRNGLVAKKPRRRRSATPASQAARSCGPTTAGARTSRASSEQATGCTATRSR